MDYREEYVCHIKDEYFARENDPHLMQNKENGSCRLSFYRMRDEKTSLLWLVPPGSRVEKFQSVYDRQIKKYGNCRTIVLGEYDGRLAAFLLQNMFPVTEKYPDHVHTRNNNPVPVKYSIQSETGTKVKRMLQLHARGKKIVFPGISRLESLMLEEATFGG